MGIIQLIGCKQTLYCVIIRYKKLGGINKMTTKIHCDATDMDYGKAAFAPAGRIVDFMKETGTGVNELLWTTIETPLWSKSTEWTGLINVVSNDPDKFEVVCGLVDAAIERHTVNESDDGMDEDEDEGFIKWDDFVKEMEGLNASYR
jgi:hypothetical protein